MRVEVVIGDWEHQCCGENFRRGDVVEWACYSEADGILHETHHELEGVPLTHVRGTIVDLFAGDADQWTRIERVPSGRALRGFDPEDGGDVVALKSGAVLDPSSVDFLVIVEPTR